MSDRRFTHPLAAVAIAAGAMLAAAGASAAPFAYVTNRGDATVSVIDMASNTVTATVPVGNNPNSVAVTKDNAHVYVANYNDNSISVIDAISNTVTTTLPGVCVGPTWLMLTPDGSEVWLSCWRDWTVHRINVATNTQTGTITAVRAPLGIAFKSDFSRAYVVNNSGFTLAVIDPATNTVLQNPTIGFNSLDVALDPTERYAYIAANGDNKIDVIDLTGQTSMNWYSLPSSPITVIANASGVHLYTPTNDGNVYDINAAAFLTTPVAVGAGPKGVDLNADGTRLYVTNSDSNTVSVIDTSTRTVVATIPVGNSPWTYGRFIAKGPPPATGVSTPPLNLVASAGNGQASVAFDPPAAPGGAILHYTMTCGSTSAIGSASPIVVTGLSNGITVTCTAVATNSLGDSGPSAPSNPVTPIGVVPGAPGSVSAVGGNRRVTVFFAPPGYDGGEAITSYRATCGTQSAAGTSAPIVVSGLANGTAVTCTVLATNRIGDGPASAPSNSVTPASVPDAPGGVVATRGNTQVGVSFVPGDSEGSPISGYRATCGTQSASAAATPITVTGLSNGVTVTCTVVASNALGDSVPSLPSNAVTPATVPDTPTGVSVTRGNRQVTVNFSPGPSNGGSAISAYTATCGTQSATAAASPVTVANLTNGSAVTCSVIASNDAGNSAPSAASNSVIPATVPDAPLSLLATRGNAQVGVDFAAGASDGGLPVTGFTLSCGSHAASGGASPLVVSGLPNGTPVSCTAIASNGVGDSAPSAPSNTVTPATVPGAPTTLVATPGDGRVSVAFAAPLDNGGSAISAYIASCADQSGFALASPATVTGLGNGVPVTCYVYAINDVGNGPASAASTPVTPGPGADVAISVDNGATFLRGGTPVDYVIDVSNRGTTRISGARVQDALGAAFSTVAWICSGQDGGSCTSAGTGDLDTLVDLPVGAGVSFLLSGTLAPLPEAPVTNTATVTLPAGYANADAGNGSASDGPDAVGIFRDSFE